MVNKFQFVGNRTFEVVGECDGKEIVRNDFGSIPYNYEKSRF